MTPENFSLILAILSIYAASEMKTVKFYSTNAPKCNNNKPIYNMLTHIVCLIKIIFQDKHFPMHCFKMFENLSLISWLSRRQRILTSASAFTS